VIVNPTTRDSYRASMTLSNLVLSAPADATNSILLNLLNTGVPFTILERCRIKDCKCLFKNFRWKISCVHGGKSKS